MQCVLTPQQATYLFQKIGNDLRNLSNAVDLKNYLKDIYGTILDATNDKDKSLYYVSIIPEYMRTLLGINKNISRKHGSMFQNIVELEQSFENFDNVVKYANDNFISTILVEELKQSLLDESLESGNVIQAELEKSDIKETEKTIDLAPLSQVLGFSDVTMEQTLSGKKQVIEEDVNPILANVKREIIENINPDGSSSIKGVGKITMKLISTSVLPSTALRKKLNDTRTPEQIQTDNFKGVVLAAFDESDNIVYLDNSGNKSSEINGTAVYYFIPSPIKFEDSDKYKLSTTAILLKENIAKTKNISTKQAEELLQQQLKAIDTIRKYINENPKDNNIPVNLTGSYLPITYNSTLTTNKDRIPLNLINFGNKPFTLTVADNLGKPTETYATAEEQTIVKGKPLLQSDKYYYVQIPNNPNKYVIAGQAYSQELIDKLTSLLFDKYKYDVGREVEMPTARRLELFNQFVFIPKGANLQIIDDGKNLILRKADGGIIEFENLEEAKNKVAEYLKTIKMQPRHSLVKNNKFIDFTIENGVLKENQNANYSEFIRQNFSIIKRFGELTPFIKFDLNVTAIKNKEVTKKQKELENKIKNEPVKEQGIVNSEVLIENDEVVADKQEEVIKEVITEQKKDLNILQKAYLTNARKNKPDAYNKLYTQKRVKADLKQLEEAENWFKNSPLSKYITLDKLFEMVNPLNNQSVATFSRNAITLFKGSDMSDVYHEAWHAFTQSFLTQKQKKELYSELAKKTGTFIDYSGKKVKFSQANELQLEEFLAEDFREYILSDGKKILGNSAVRNTIFRKIMNFIKSLFGKTSYKQAISNDNVSKNIQELFDNLKVGNLAKYTFDVNNRNFDTLNLTIGATREVEKQKSLSTTYSMLILNTVNSLFSEFADINNEYLTEEQVNRQSQLQAKQATSELNAEELTELEGLNKPKQTYKYTTSLFETEEGLKETYGYVKHRMEFMLDEAKELLKNENTTGNKFKLQERIDLLNWSLRNFGDVDNLFSNTASKGVIGYHLVKSDYVANEFKQEIIDDELEANVEKEGRQAFDKTGTESSIFDLATKEISNIIKGLPKYDSNGEIVTNLLGIQELSPFGATFAQIAKITQNLSTPQQMYDALKSQEDNFPFVKNLLDKLGPVESESIKELRNWTRFYQTFNLYFFPLNTTIIEKTTIYNELGEIKDVKNSIKVGDAVTGYKDVGFTWSSDFVNFENHPFVRKNNEGFNYLDTTELLKKYPEESSIYKDPYTFLRDIGINLSNTVNIKNLVNKAVEDKKIIIAGFWQSVHILDSKNIRTKHINDFIYRNKETGIKGEESNYNKLMKIEYYNSGNYSDFMVRNANNDPQSELTLNTTLTQTIKFINEANSFAELVSMPQMSWLNPTYNNANMPYNSFTTVSVLLNSIFNMEVEGGPKRAGAELLIKNLNGIIQRNDGNFVDGSLSVDLDEYNKFIKDIHEQLISGTPEISRKAGKNTSVGIKATELVTYTGKTTKYLYIDTETFAIKYPNEIFTEGDLKGVEIVYKYVLSELSRINKAKELIKNNTLQEFDFDYLNRATEFTQFAGTLSKDTLDKLYKIEEIDINKLQTILTLPENKALKQKIEDELIEYFNNRTIKNIKKLNESKYLTPLLYESIKAEISNEEKEIALMKSFTYNNFINTYETTLLLDGDVGLYKSAADYSKRTGTINSSGKLIRNDKPFIDIVNEKLGRKLAEKLGVSADIRYFNGTSRTAIVADVMTRSQYVEEYAKTLKPTLIEKYEDVNEGDAAAFVTLDTYRIYREGLGTWTEEDETFYQNEVNGKFNTNEVVKRFYGTIKLGYNGPLQTAGLPLKALHKFALYPLIPSVIKGTNLELLHNSLMKQGIDYITFKSGSKVSTITKGKEKDGKIIGVSDELYANKEKRVLSITDPDYKFTPNIIYNDFLKEQVITGNKYKGKISNFTQLRQFATLGLMDEGKPVDFKGTVEEWNNLSEEEKLKNDAYVLVSNYQNALDKLIQNKKESLLKELDWKEQSDGTFTGSIRNLASLVSTELRRKDYPEHSIKFIQMMKDDELSHSLDISTYSEDIEKVLMSIINKRLIKFKLKGEQLVNIASTGFENIDFAYKNRNLEKPSVEDLDKYGSNDLPTYRKGKDGKTVLAKCKIAIQGDFMKLLNLKEVKDKAEELGIDRLKALNIIIKDKEWLSKNSKFITIIGARIPTQAISSVEAVEVYEFLPSQAGNIIILPTEVTAKVGLDFDYDKLPMMFPNIDVIDDEIVTSRIYTKEEAQAIYDKIVNNAIIKSSLTNDNKPLNKTSQEAKKQIEEAIQKLMGYTYEGWIEELKAGLKADGKIPTFESFYDRLTGTRPLENELQNSLLDIMKSPYMYERLISPNVTTEAEALAKAVRKRIEEKDEDIQGKWNGIFDYLYNMRVHQSNTIGKNILGIAAIDAKFNATLNTAGLKLKNTRQLINAKGDTFDFPIRILLPSNQTKDNEIILSALLDSEKNNTISEILSQLLNGAVDVEKDDWISYIQGNKEVFPTLLFLIIAGVPLVDAVYFVSNSLIREYAKLLKLQKSPIGKLLSNKSARQQMFEKIRLDDSLLESKIGTLYYINLTVNPKDLTREKLRQDLIENNKGNISAFLHFLELQDMVSAYGELKRNFNNDTNLDTTSFELTKRINKDREGILNFIEEKYIQKLQKSTPVGLFNNALLANDLLQSILPIKNNKIINDIVADPSFKKIFKNEKDVAKFKNAIISYLFHNTVRGFNIDETNDYKDFEIVKDLTAESTVIIKDNKIIINEDKINAEFEGSLFLQEGITEGTFIDVGLSNDTFTSKEEYTHFLLEKVTLKALNNEEKIKKDYYYKLLKDRYAKELLGKYDTEEVYENNVNEFALKEWLNVKALYNIFNPKVMIKGSNTLADIFSKIKQSYPELGQLYPVMNGIGKDVSKNENVKSLRITGGRIDSDTADVFNENLKALATGKNFDSILKGNDIDFIQNFFYNLSANSYLLTGSNLKNPFSLGRIIDMTPITNILNKEAKDFAGKINEELVLDMLVLYQTQSYNLRGSDYLKRDVNLEKNESVNPIYIIDKNLKNKDGSKRFGSTDGTTIKINPVENVEDFFDYFEGKNDSVTSKQKLKVLEGLNDAGYSLDKIKSILNTPELINKFLVLHEQSHIDNNDKSIYWKNGKDLLTKDKIDLEIRATLDALNIIEKNNNMRQLKLFVESIKNKNDNTYKLTDYINHSGGAYGGDTYWDIIGREFGVKNHKHYRDIANTSLSKQLKERGIKAEVLSKNQMDKARVEISNLLGIKYKDDLRGNLQVRNYYQVANSDAVFAIAKLDSDKKGVNGGTNTAVQLAIRLNKPVYVWDINTEKWYLYKNNNFIESDVPILTPNFAGVGSRNIEDYNVLNKKTGKWESREEYVGKDKEESAKKAIRAVYEKTKNTLLNSANNTYGLSQQEWDSLTIEEKQKIKDCN